MLTIIQFFTTIFESLTLIVLYSQVSGVQFKKIHYLSLIFAEFFLVAIAVFAVGESFAGYLILIVFFLTFSLLLTRSLPKLLSIFYGLFPLVLWNVIHRILTFFVLPVIGLTYQEVRGNRLILIASAFISSLLSLSIPRLLHYDFKRLQEFQLDGAERRLLILLNISMVVYYIFSQLFVYWEETFRISTFPYRQFFVVIYVIIFLSSVNVLDRSLRERIQQELDHRKELQLKNMGDYSRHIEELYRELRSFRHDYANVLVSLRLGIENRDMDSIEKVYNTVLKDSGQSLREGKYDLGRLVNVSDDALKSLLSAKFIEAESKQIAISMEVPHPIEPRGMELLDFVTLVSILTDNAIEAAADSDSPSLSIAYLEQEDRQLFIVENSTREERVDISQVFEWGVSSKGRERGIGLSNLQRIIDRSPNVSMRTSSQDHHFRQRVEILLYQKK